MRDIIIKRSNLNKIAYPQVEGFNIKRALTIKEALNKQSKEKYDCIIIEAASDIDLENIQNLLNVGTSLSDELILVLLTQPDTELNIDLLQSIRNTVENSRQVTVINKYTEGTSYEELLNEITILYDAMKVAYAQVEQQSSEGEEQVAESQELNLAEDIKFRGIEVDSEQLINLQYQLNSVNEELRIAKEFIDKMTNNPNITELTIGGTEATRLYDENDELQKEIDRLKSAEATLAECQTELSKAKLSNKAEQLISMTLRTLLNRVYQYAELMKKENIKYAQTADEANDKLNKLQMDYDDLQETRKELNEQITLLTNSNVELQDKNAELNIDLGVAIDTGNQLHSKIDELDNIIAKLTDDKRKLGVDLSKANAEIARLSTYDVELLKKQAVDGSNVQEILEERLRQFKEEVKNLDTKNKALTKELTVARNRIEKLTDEKRVLERLLDGEAYEQQGIIWSRAIQARLLTFIGHGGQGCSSLVAGIAKRLYSLGKNVVIIDCDFRAPKLHAIFDVNPVIDYTQFSELGQSELKTSLGKILVLKERVFENFEKELIINLAANTKSKTNNRLDMLSGLVSMRSSSEVSGIDFNSICIELSAKYDYILVDLGRSEGSGGISRQQAAFMQNANRRFIVTSNNLECVKSILTRLVQARIDINTCELVFNLVQEKEDRNLQTIMARVRNTYFIPFNKHMAGKVIPLTETDSTVKQIVATELGSASSI